MAPAGGSARRAPWRRGARWLGFLALALRGAAQDDGLGLCEYVDDNAGHSSRRSVVHLVTYAIRHTHLSHGAL